MKQHIPYHLQLSKYRINLFGTYLAGEQFLCNLICSSISEYPALLTSEENKMASSFVYVTEEELFFFLINASRPARQYPK